MTIYQDGAEGKVLLDGRLLRSDARLRLSQDVNKT